MNNNLSKIGPIQILAIAFKPDSKFEGKILNEFQKLEKNKILRVLDILFVMKEKDGSELIALNLQGEELGGIVGTLLGFEFEGEEKRPAKKVVNESIGLNSQDIEKLGEALTPGMAAGIVLMEHVWARDLKNAIRSTGGVPIAEGFITQEAFEKVANEIEILTKTMDQLEEEEKHQRMYA